MALTIENTNLVISTEPEYADQIVTLTSSDTSVVEPVIVSTSDAGVHTYALEPRGVGTATITATADSGATSSVEVTVTEGAGEDEGAGGSGSTRIPVERVYFHAKNSYSDEIETLGLALNKSGQIEMSPYITVEPEDATDRGWRLVSSNTNILGILGTSVSTVAAGTCSLTVLTDSDGCADTISVTVSSERATSIAFTNESLSLAVGATKDLANYLIFTPELSVYDGYTLSSSQTGIARITGSSVKGVAPGESTITVTTNSGKSATMTVVVIGDSGSTQEGDIPSVFYISCSKTRLTAGEEATVWIREVMPEGIDLAASGELQLSIQNSRCYVSSGPDEDGMFTIKAINDPGSESIRMKWRNSSSGWINSDTIVLTITEAESSGGGSDSGSQNTLNSVTISMNSVGRIPGDTVQASAILSPSSYSPASITWTSSNPAVASVSDTGLVNCLEEGTVTISVNVDGVTGTRTFVVGNDNGSETNPADWAEDDVETPLRGTNVAAPIVPFTTADRFATHYAKYGKGGYRSVSNISERNAIPEERREEGMLAWVISESKLYQLKNGYWVEASFGGTTEVIDGGECHCGDLESRVAYLESILLAQQQAELKRQLDNNPYNLNITGLQPSGSKYEVGTNVGSLSFNYNLSGPSPVPAMQSAVINGATFSPASGSYSGGTVNSSSAGNKELYSISVTYFDTRYAQLDEYKDAGGKTRTATSSKNIMFGYKIYCGKTTLSPDNFTWSNLSSSVVKTSDIVTALPAKSSPLTFSYTVRDGRAWVAYPKSWGQAVDIRDSKGDSYAVNFSFKEITVPVAGNNVQYYVYYLTGISSVTDFEFNFSKK